MNQRAVWLPLLLAAFMGIGYMLGGYFYSKKPVVFEAKDEIDQELLKIKDVYHLINEQYFADIDFHLLTDSVIAHITDQLDKTSVYRSQESAYNTESITKLNLHLVKIDSNWIVSNINSPFVTDKFTLGDEILSINKQSVEDYGQIDINQQEIDLMLDASNIEIELISFFDRDTSTINFKLASKKLLDQNTIISKIHEDILYCKLFVLNSESYKQLIERMHELGANQQLDQIVLDFSSLYFADMESALKLCSQLAGAEQRAIAYGHHKDRSPYEYKTSGRSFFEYKNVAGIVSAQTAPIGLMMASFIGSLNNGIAVGQEPYRASLKPDLFYLSDSSQLTLATQILSIEKDSFQLFKQDYNADIISDFDNHVKYLYNQSITSASDIIEQQQAQIKSFIVGYIYKYLVRNRKAFQQLESEQAANKAYQVWLKTERSEKNLSIDKDTFCRLYFYVCCEMSKSKQQIECFEKSEFYHRIFKEWKD